MNGLSASLPAPITDISGRIVRVTPATSHLVVTVRAGNAVGTGLATAPPLGLQAALALL